MSPVYISMHGYKLYLDEMLTKTTIRDAISSLDYINTINVCKNSKEDYYTLSMNISPVYNTVDINNPLMANNVHVYPMLESHFKSNQEILEDFQDMLPVTELKLDKNSTTKLITSNDSTRMYSMKALSLNSQDNTAEAVRESLKELHGEANISAINPVNIFFTHTDKIMLVDVKNLDVYTVRTIATTTIENIEDNKLPDISEMINTLSDNNISVDSITLIGSM